MLEKQRREEAARAQVQEKKEPDTTPYYKKWWFWALTAAVVGGTVALGVWAIDPSDHAGQGLQLGRDRLLRRWPERCR